MKPTLLIVVGRKQEKWIPLATTWKYSLPKENLGKYFCLGKRTSSPPSVDVAHIRARKRRAQKQNWRNCEMTHSTLFENMVSFSIQWSFVQCSSRYLQGKGPIPRQYNRFDHWQDDHSLEIPACGAVCHILCHFPDMLDLLEAEMIFMCNSEKDCIQDWGSFAWQISHARTCSFSMLSQLDSGPSAAKIQRTGCFWIFFIFIFGMLYLM